MEKKKFYVTTPIYYPNDKLHIGHCYTTVAADTLKRYKVMRGYDALFLTGTDEHGQKIARVAAEIGTTPQAHVDRIADWIKDLWKIMNIEYDVFVRTTDESHEKTVQKIFKKLYDKGAIYKNFYEGMYCAPCESFFTEHQLVDGKCPDCGRDVELVKEEAYFFKLSEYQDRLMKHIEDNPDFIKPVSRKNEMVNNFIKPGLEDLCVSRTSFTWGVPVDFDEGHVVYVWIDALSCYLTGLGYMSENDERYKKYWPADVHLMAKEIVRFHAIIWPAILMALDEPLPHQIFGHGWLVFDGGKMSKSKGNVVDPKILIEKYGVDAIRYFLMREVVFGQDGNFSNEALITRINSDLANDLGNLLSRTVGMIDKYFGGALPLEQEGNEFDGDVIALCKKTVTEVTEYMDNLAFNDALSHIWTFIRRNNKYIDETQPWVLAKDESKKARLAGIMYTLAESLRIISILITPVMPNTPKAVYEQLGINDENLKTWDSAGDFGKLHKDIKINKGGIVFPRIDVEKELAELALMLGTTEPEKKEEKKTEKIKEVAPKAEITIEDFLKLDLRVGEVLKCEKIEGSDKLLKSQIKVGERIHQIVSGISKHYTPEEMVGKKVIVAANLKPVKLRGVLSEGMILAASDADGKLSVLTPDREIGDGSVVS
ncbi:MAG: methionine--tRNA ligase [Clostridiales bacterium]|nr:methionine--tRNA ligase [Clostridiales bacterium]